MTTMRFKTADLIRLIEKRQADEKAAHAKAAAEHAKTMAAIPAQAADALERLAAQVRSGKLVPGRYSENFLVEIKGGRKVDVLDVAGIAVPKPPAKPACRESTLAWLRASTTEEVTMGEDRFAQIVGSSC